MRGDITAKDWIPLRSSTSPVVAVSAIDPLLYASVYCVENGGTNSLVPNSYVTLSESEVVITPCVNVLSDHSLAGC